MKHQILFSRKNIIRLSSADFAHNMVSVNEKCLEFFLISAQKKRVIDSIKVACLRQFKWVSTTCI